MWLGHGIRDRSDDRRPTVSAAAWSAETAGSRHGGLTVYDSTLGVTGPGSDQQLAAQIDADGLRLSDREHQLRAGLLTEDATVSLYVQDRQRSAVWHSVSDAAGGFENYRRQTAGETAWNLAGCASTLKDGFDLLRAITGSDK